MDDQISRGSCPGSGEAHKLASQLGTRELLNLIDRVFGAGANSSSLAILVDLPSAEKADNERWAARRRTAFQFAEKLQDATRRGHSAIDCSLYVYPNVGNNNADLPRLAWRVIDLSTEICGDLLPAAEGSDLAGVEVVCFAEDIFARHDIMISLTELSATAPLKIAARKYDFRAATMGGFSAAMIPALRVDLEELDRRCQLLWRKLDRATGADIEFSGTEGQIWRLELDLRYRRAHVSSGLLSGSQRVGNLPSGECYCVPYEGENPDTQSRSNGDLPIQFDPRRDELAVLKVRENRVREITGGSCLADRQRRRLSEEPAYGNIAELGLGLLDHFGIEAVGEVMLDEKLGLHIALGRSDHLGGSIGTDSFRNPANAIHVDWVYVASSMPLINVARVELSYGSGESEVLIRDGRYVISFSKDDRA